jgi:hypothetical protein
VGVALVTSGPGATNAVTGLATAYMDSIPMVVMPGWRSAARRIGFAAALADPTDLAEDGYAALHDGAAFEQPIPHRPGVFYIDRIGGRKDHFDDSGIEYYRYHS